MSVPPASRHALRFAASAIAGAATFFAANALGVAWVRGSEFSSGAFHDGFAAGLTLAVPAFASGLAVALLAPARRINIALILFGTLAVLGFFLPIWQVPLVSPQAVHSGALHYFLRSPLCLLSFALLGTWLGEQFATRRFSLSDTRPVLPADMGDD